MIRFFHDNFLTLNEGQISAWLDKIAQSQGYVIEKFDFNFVDSDRMLALNRDFLSHDTHTDIMTFDYTIGQEIVAEAYISFSALTENAKEYNQGIEEETLRLISHALLHCLGYKDKKDDERAEMRAKEDECITMFHVKQ